MDARRSRDTNAQFYLRLTALNLIFADNAFLPIHLALDPILKHIPRLGKLPNNFVAALCFAVLTKTG